MARDTDILGLYCSGHCCQYLGHEADICRTERGSSGSCGGVSRQFRGSLGLLACQTLSKLRLYFLSKRLWMVEWRGGLVYWYAFELLCLGWLVF